MNTNTSILVTDKPIVPAHIHIRLFDEEGEIASNGGASVAYHLHRNNEDQVVALCGISVCSDLDNFNKKLGNKIAASRLHKLMSLLEHGTDSALLTMVVPIASSRQLVEEGVDVTVLGETDFFTFVLIKEDDFPFQETLITAAIEAIRSHRADTYMGSDPDVLESIDEMFSVDEEDDDETVDADVDFDEEEDSEEEDGNAEDSEAVISRLT